MLNAMEKNAETFCRPSSYRSDLPSSIGFIPNSLPPTALSFQLCGFSIRASKLPSFPTSIFKAFLLSLFSFNLSPLTFILYPLTFIL